MPVDFPDKMSPGHMYAPRRLERGISTRPHGAYVCSRTLPLDQSGPLGAHPHARTVIISFCMCKKKRVHAWVRERVRANIKMKDPNARMHCFAYIFVYVHT